MKRFNDDDIRRRDVPVDCFLLLHDLAYDHLGRDRTLYALAAQRILSSPTDIKETIYATAIPVRPTQIVIDLARELYDRFVMGGWEPQDAYPTIARMLADASPDFEKEAERGQTND